MNVVASLGPHPEPAELVQPRGRALDNPAVLAEPASVRGVALREHRLDPARAKLPPVRFRIVGAVAVGAIRTTARTPALAADRRDRVNQAEKLGYVVAVRAGELRYKRCGSRLSYDMVLAGLARPGRNEWE